MENLAMNTVVDNGDDSPDWDARIGRWAGEAENFRYGITYNVYFCNILVT